jgi:hypothetical protein
VFVQGSRRAARTALGRMARTVSETLEPKDVFARVAEGAATAVPFDTMVVFRGEGPDAFELSRTIGAAPLGSAYRSIQGVQRHTPVRVKRHTGFAVGPAPPRGLQ